MTQEHTPSAPRFSSPQTELMLRLLRVSDQLERAFQQRLRPFSLTHPQYNVLRILRGAGSAGLTCSAIGRSMITAVPDITRLLARLQARRLVVQHRDTGDRRVVWTRITARGLALLQSLDPIVEQAPLDLLRSLTEAQVRDLNQLLQRIAIPVEEEPLKRKKSTGNAQASAPLACPSTDSGTAQIADTLPAACPTQPRAIRVRHRSSRLPHRSE